MMMSPKVEMFKRPPHNKGKFPENSTSISRSGLETEETYVEAFLVQVSSTETKIAVRQGNNRSLNKSSPKPSQFCLR